MVQLLRTVDGNSHEKLIPPHMVVPLPPFPVIPTRENPACPHPRVAQREQGWGLWLMMWISCSWVFLASCYTTASRHWRRELRLSSWLFQKTPDLGAYSWRRKTLNGNFWTLKWTLCLPSLTRTYGTGFIITTSWCVGKNMHLIFVVILSLLPQMNFSHC